MKKIPLLIGCEACIIGDYELTHFCWEPFSTNSVWWLTYPSEKSWSSSVGMKWHSQLNSHNPFMFQTTNQWLLTIINHHYPILNQCSSHHQPATSMMRWDRARGIFIAQIHQATRRRCDGVPRPAPPRGCPQSDQFLFGKTHEQKHGKRQIYFPSINFAGIMRYPFFLSNSKKCMKIDLNQPESDLDHRKKTSQTSILFAQEFKCGCFRWHFNITCGYCRNLKTHQRSCRSWPRLCRAFCAAKGQTWLDVRNVIQQMANIHLRFGEFGSLMETLAAINLPFFHLRGWFIVFIAPIYVYRIL